MSRDFLSVTQELDAIDRNNHFLIIDDDVDVLNYYRTIFERKDEGDSDLRLLREIAQESEEVVEKEKKKERRCCFSPTVARSGEEGVRLSQQALAERIPYTVAFVDMRMPGGIDGLETCKQLREQDPRIMLVIVTAYSDRKIDDIHQEILRDLLFLNKPLSVDEAIQTVRMLNQNWKEREKNKVLKMQMMNSEKMASLGCMAVRIGHEINQPLSYINGILQLQQMELQSNKMLDLDSHREEIELALQQTKRIGEVIKSLRLFAHPDIEKREMLVLSDVVKNIVTLFGGELKREKIKLNMGFESELPPLYANPSQLQRILTNLLSNAIDALIEKRQDKDFDDKSWAPEILLSASLLADKKGLEVVFADNGFGIPSSLKERIFDPFVTTKEPGKGTGLGLSEVHGMLQEYGATIEYRALPDDGGASFIIHFPFNEQS
ncbi:MAG: response regulator [Thiotrichales bacterium]|nr:response regulator [Thiotrichales bacterium]MBT3614347.1 response regulator [Thiotrichales bacterium]MBT3752689.1 response regulator [Thiotrichales bacterium]MBT3837274.1 response regulator [Thiotrichales bacterium]MBT4152567.1 response regulator [Thiotrichales bacterium]